ncbi:3-hydroxybutyryl-CoA dehydrogenase [Macrococcoides caseolyticum]|nr:3-hydroxybutyryl-CoA dehydrogenase [Macrococcus caseolyticus]
MDIKNVTVAGAGVLGSQIAFQAAFFGFNVTLYDIRVMRNPLIPLFIYTIFSYHYSYEMNTI